MKYYCCVYCSISILVCLPNDHLSWYFSSILSHKLTKWNSLSYLHLCITCRRTPAHTHVHILISSRQPLLNERSEYYTIPSACSAAECWAMRLICYFFVCLQLSVFSPFLLLISCLLLTLSLESSSSSGCVGGKDCVGWKTGWGNAWHAKHLGYFSDWDFWLCGWLGAWLTTKWRRLLLWLTDCTAGWLSDCPCDRLAGSSSSLLNKWIFAWLMATISIQFAVW